MSIPLAQNFYKETVTTDWSTGGGNFYVSQKPVIDVGYMVISPNSPTKREIVKFTAVGTDGGGDYVTVTQENRGIGGTIEQTHDVGESAYINVVAEHIQELATAFNEAVLAGAVYASNTFIGVTKLDGDSDEVIGNVTITIASPAVVTFTAHGLVAGDRIEFSTDGSLPTGITAGNSYYVIGAGLTANSFSFSDTVGGTAINTSGSQSGTHTLTKTTPVAVSKNSPLLPTAAQTAALAGDGGTPSATNTFKLKSITKLAGETISGATTPVPVYQDKTDNEFYACDANDTNKLKFIGFAVTDGTDGNDIEVQTTGIVSGFTGLAEGEKYYVQDTVGTIGNTIGTYEVLVGIAISETQLVIQKGRRQASGDGQSLGTASGSLAVTCGFRPSVVRITAIGGNNQALTYMNAVWANGAIKGVSGYYNEGTGGNSVLQPRINGGGNGSDYMTFSITSVTDTGFTINWTETGSFPAGPVPTFSWEAEGEI